jgi:hypothetical protein
MSQNFWLDDPCALFTPDGPTFLPTTNMSKNQKLNAISRSIILLSILMFYCDFGVDQGFHHLWLDFFLVGLIFVIIFKYKDSTSYKEGYVNPTYLEGTLYDGLTVVPPIFSEEWQIPSPVYDEYTLLPEVDNIPEVDSFGGNDRPVYGQYITNSNMLPHNMPETRNMSLEDTKLYMNDEFTNDTIQFRNDMMRTTINKMNREYRNSCFDQISPGNSF